VYGVNPTGVVMTPVWIGETEALMLEQPAGTVIPEIDRPRDPPENVHVGVAEPVPAVPWDEKQFPRWAENDPCEPGLRSTSVPAPKGRVSTTDVTARPAESVNA
jgi:hypothetical protein